MTDYQLSAYASRFFRTTLRPLANVALGIDATVDVGGAEWAKIKAELDAANVQQGDVLVTDDAAVDGTGSPTYAQVDAVIAMLGVAGGNIKAEIVPLAILHTQITLPQ